MGEARPPGGWPVGEGVVGKRIPGGRSDANLTLLVYTRKARAVQLVRPADRIASKEVGEPADSNTEMFFGLDEVTEFVSPGTSTFGVECRELNATDSFSVSDVQLSAVAVGGQ